MVLDTFYDCSHKVSGIYVFQHILQVIGNTDGLLDEKLEITRPLLSALKEMTDFASFMCNPIFLALAISNILGFLALYIPYVYLPHMMTKQGIESSNASFVISLIGVTNTLGRSVCKD